MGRNAASKPEILIGPVLPLDDEPDEPSDLEVDGLPMIDDDANWEVFIPDDDQRDPLPEPGDFWIQRSDGFDSAA